MLHSKILLYLDLDLGVGLYSKIQGLVHRVAKMSTFSDSAFAKSRAARQDYYDFVVDT